jgi:hypothetical protein
LYHRKKDHKGSISILILTCFFLFSSVIMSNPPSTLQGSPIGFRGFASSSNIPILGAEGVSEGGSASQSFVSGIASQGLKWDADCLCYLTPSDMSMMANAGINVLGLEGTTPETSCGSGVLQSEATYKAAIQHDVNLYPTIHSWEYGLEVETPCYNPPTSYDQGWNIGPQNYFIGLVWAYQAITTVAGHSSDTIQGPGETIWTGSNGAANDSCYNTYQMNWFKSFWGQSYQGYTPSSVLNYVDLDVYTGGGTGPLQWTDNLGQSGLGGTCASMTVSQMLTIALNDYHNISGKTIWIFGTGFPPNGSGGLSAQTQWYKGMVPFYQSLGYIGAVFAYCLVSCNEALFSSYNLANYYPAWSAYQSFFSSNTSSSLTNITSSSSTNSQVSSSIISSSSVTDSTSSSSPTSFVFSKLDPLSEIFPAISLGNDAALAYGFTTYQLCLIGGLVYFMIRARKQGRYNLNNQLNGWWSSILKALFSWTETGHLLPQSTKQFGFYENAATRGINAEGYLPVRKYRRSNAVKRQTERTTGQRKAGATKLSKVSGDILIQASEKKDSRQKRKKRAIERVPKDIRHAGNKAEEPH